MEQNNQPPIPDKTPINNDKKELASYLSADSDYVFLVKKIEKMVAALYLVSNFFSEDEPLKKTFKTRGISLLQSLLGLDGVVLFASPEKVTIVEGKLAELALLLSVAHTSGLVSDMNFEVLQRELGLVLEILSKRRHYNNNSHTTKQAFPESFFTVPTNQLSLGTESVLPKGLVMAGGVSKEAGYVADSGRKAPNPKDILLPESSVKGQTDLMDLSELGLKSKNKTKRVTAIINLLKRKKNLGIKDFTSVIQGCSEKTIQRELLFLMKRGLIKKTGDRRWSRYTLN